MAGHAGGVVARLGAQELIASVPALGDADVQLRPVDFRRLPSACLRFADVLDLLAAAEQAVREGADGVVVVQGTDTIEETAYLADLLWPLDVPLVVTGAMRNPRLAGPDGPANLFAAVAVAADRRWRGLGALVVLNDEVHAARFVVKRHSTSTAAFTSPDVGPLGRFAEGGARPAVVPGPQRPLVRPESLDVRVPLATIVFDDDGLLLADLEHRVDGLVIAGFGVGHVPDRLAGRLGELATQIPVVLASRTGAGPVLTRTYGFAGSETDLLGRGLIPAGMLHPTKARILLAVLLASGADRAAIEDEFAARSGQLT